MPWQTRAQAVAASERPATFSDGHGFVPHPRSESLLAFGRHALPSGHHDFTLLAWSTTLTTTAPRGRKDFVVMSSNEKRFKESSAVGTRRRSRAESFTPLRLQLLGLIMLGALLTGLLVFSPSFVTVSGRAPFHHSVLLDEAGLGGLEFSFNVSRCPGTYFCTHEHRGRAEFFPWVGRVHTTRFARESERSDSPSDPRWSRV